MKELQGIVKKAESAVKKAKFDVGDMFTEVKDGIAALAGVSKEISAELKSDPESAIEALEAAYETLDQIRDQAELVQMAGNASDAIKKIEKDLKDGAKIVKSLEKKQDVSDLKDILADANAVVKEMKAAVKSGDIETAG